MCWLLSLVLTWLFSESPSKVFSQTDSSSLTSYSYNNNTLTIVAAAIVSYKYKANVTKIMYPLDATAFHNKMYIDQMWPAMEIAFADSLNKYNVHFDVEYYTYEPCQVDVHWYSMKVLTEIVRNVSRRVDVLVGPSCAQDVQQAGIASTVFPTMLLTGGASLADKLEQNPNVVRCSYSTFTQWSGLLDMALQFNWTNFGIIFDDTDSARHIWATSLMTRMDTNKLTYVQSSLMALSDIPSILETVRKQARVIVIMAPTRLREFMLAAQQEGMTNGEYIYFTIDTFPNDTILALNNTESWQHGNANDTKAMIAYQSLFFWAVRDIGSTPEFQTFNDAAKAKSLHGPYPDPNYVANYFAATFHDCIIALATAVRKADSEGVDFRKNYTATMRNYVANSTTVGVSGSMRISPNGDRNEDFALFGITNRQLGIYGVVGYFNGAENRFTIRNDSILWPAPNNKPPLNEPHCGYEGDKDICHVVTSYALPIALGVSIPGGVILIAVAVFYYRRMKQQEKEDQSWIAHWKDLKVIRPGGPSANEYDNRGKDVEDDEEKPKTANGDVDDDQKEVEKTSEGAADKDAGIKLTMNTGLWKKQAVTVRWSKKRRMRLTKEILRQAREVRTLTHDNLMLFKGACLEDDRILIIYENCSKGCLTDLIMDANIKLDWTLRFSLMSDCMKGVSYLHNHIVKVHGRLNSMCCYVDSRFMLKVGDYGLHAFFELTLAELWAAKREPDYLTAQLWKAPEHLKAEAQSRYEVVSSVSQKGDVYSFGIIIQELILRTKPFSMYAIPEEEIIEAIKQSANEIHPRFVPKIDETACPAELAELCDQCWAVDPAKRPNMVKVRANLKELGKQLGMGERSNILDTLLQQMEDMELNLQAIVDEKGEMLLDEKNRSDELLYSVLPKEVAEVMKVGEKAKAENFEQVSMMHCDIQEYADLAAESTALQMVDLINDITDFYDSIIRKYDAYKIDTFRDNTLIVSGLPKRNGIFHAREIARVGLNLLFLVQRFKVRHRPASGLTIRMGIHAGPVMAGVVGAVIPRYLLFGDTMSVSSQMLTGGEPMKIQLSLTSKSCLDKVGNFDLMERGEIFVKGKGAMKTYWLLGEDGNSDLEDLRYRFEHGIDDTVKEENDEDDDMSEQGPTSS